MIKVRITPKMLNSIVHIVEMNQSFSSVVLPTNIMYRLRKNSKKKSSYASTSIEGNPLTEEQANNAIEGRGRHYLKPEQEIRNYYNALEYLEKALEKHKKVSKEMLLRVQKEVVRGESKEKIGIRGPMPPGVLFAVYDSNSGEPEYIPPAAEDIEPLLDELFEYLDTTEDFPLIQAGILHYQLVAIHPFEDGNGRTARLMSEYLLDYYGYDFGKIGSLDEYFLYYVDEYYQSLQMGLSALYYEGRNNPPEFKIWMEYFLRMVELYVDKVYEVATSIQDQSLQTSLSHLNQKERAFYSYLKQSRITEYRPIELAKVLNVTNRTIINWSTKLCENGLVRPVRVKQRITSYKLEKEKG